MPKSINVHLKIVFLPNVFLSDKPNVFLKSLLIHFCFHPKIVSFLFTCTSHAVR